MIVRRKAQYRDMLTMEIPWESREVLWEDPQGGYTVERVASQWDYGLEGYFLAHCMGTKDFDEFEKAHRVYSLRDAKGIPHCTILCQRTDEWSPYGRSTDLGTVEPFWPEKAGGIEVTVLQVRGRQDALAMLPFHKLVREWYEARGGKLMVADSRMDAACLSIGDDDFEYHFQHKLDESVNFFTWSYHNEKMRTWAAKEGLSL